MFRFIKQIFIYRNDVFLLLSMNNPECKVRREIINTNSNEHPFYP